jgi:nickel-dependent lactate racemase
MRVTLHYGREQLDVELPAATLIPTRHQPRAEPLADPAAAVRAALENPIGFPSLRRALTPEDHVVIVVDEHLPRLPELLTPILAHLVEAGIEPAAITLLCPQSDSKQHWLQELPEEFREVRCERHVATDRKRLSYLATTKSGHRLYFNRTAVDADQIIVLSGRGYDPILGYSGAEGSLFPALGDEASLEEDNGRISLSAPPEASSPARQEATEACWLLGAPFFVQVIAGAGDEIVHVLGGLAETSAEGRRLLDARWREKAEDLAQTVVATISGDPTRQEFSDLAAAAANAARVVQPDGRIILLSSVASASGPAINWLRQAETPDEGLALLGKHKPLDRIAAIQWAHAASRARIYLLSQMPPEIVEELFATPVDSADQIARLLQIPGTYLILEDAHRSMATAE